jgi:HlyD family secretion protein
MKKLSKTQIFGGAGALLVLILLFLILRPAPVPVDVGLVSRGPLQVTLDAEGVTRVVDRFTVAAPVAGKLMRIRLEEGDKVKRGEKVASILPPELNSRESGEASALSGSAKAGVQEADARQREVSVRLEQARLRAARYDNLYREGAVSKESWELARNEAETTGKELQAYVAARQAATYRYSAERSKIDRKIAGQAVEVPSPADGRVLKIYEKSERTVQAGTPFVDIGDPGAIEIVIDVLSSDAVSVRPGQRVLIEEWGGPLPLHATVSRKEPAAFTKVSALGIEEKRVNIIALPDKKEPQLGDNFRLQATIVLQDASNVLRVPLSSLYRKGEGWSLFVIDRGRARERRVTVGLRSVYDAEVLGGLRAGDQVVLHPDNTLKDGMRVSARPQ